MLVAARSHVGLVRQTNQDVVQISEDSNPVQYLLVADGMGGASAGEVASRIAVDTVSSVLRTAIASEEPLEDSVELLRQAMNRANQEVWQCAQENEEYFGMGTTMVAALCTENEVVFAHAGDSRGYLMHINYLKQVTKDHSLVAELVRRGQIRPDEAVNHPQRNIVTRSLGPAKDLTVDVDVLRWESGDVILLCTDGLSNLVEEQEMLAYLQPLREAVSNEDVAKVVESLLNIGLERGAPDNLTVAIAVHTEGNDEA